MLNIIQNNLNFISVYFKVMAIQVTMKKIKVSFYTILSQYYFPVDVNPDNILGKIYTNLYIIVARMDTIVFDTGTQYLLSLAV